MGKGMIILVCIWEWTMNTVSLVSVIWLLEYCKSESKTTFGTVMCVLQRFEFCCTMLCDSVLLEFLCVARISVLWCVLKHIVVIR